MTPFRFYHPIEIRYGDLDPQGHVNNASYLTYFEQGRIAYIQSLGLWQPGSFLNIGIILANARLEFRRAVVFGQAAQVGVRVSRLGNKSLEMEYSLEDGSQGLELAAGSTTLVAFDYHTQATIPLPESWRQAIAAFEGLQ